MKDRKEVVKAQALPAYRYQALAEPKKRCKETARRAEAKGAAATPKSEDTTAWLETDLASVYLAAVLIWRISKEAVLVYINSLDRHGRGLCTRTCSWSCARLAL
jgi:hypothetical protein